MSGLVNPGDVYQTLDERETLAVECAACNHVFPVEETTEVAGLHYCDRGLCLFERLSMEWAAQEGLL